MYLQVDTTSSDLQQDFANAFEQRSSFVVNRLKQYGIPVMPIETVTPIGEQGSDVAKMIVQNADWDESVAGVQLDRFCASGLEAVNIVAGQIKPARIAS